MTSKTDTDGGRRNILFIDLADRRSDRSRSLMAGSTGRFEFDMIWCDPGEQDLCPDPSLIVHYAPVSITDVESVLFKEIGRCKASFRDVPQVVVTDHDEAEFHRKCYDGGVMGVFPMETGLQTWQLALRLISSGGVFVPASMLISESRKPEG